MMYTVHTITMDTFQATAETLATLTDPRQENGAGYIALPLEEDAEVLLVTITEASRLIQRFLTEDTGASLESLVALGFPRRLVLDELSFLHSVSEHPRSPLSSSEPMNDH
jgi:hypothetical protein